MHKLTYTRGDETYSRTGAAYRLYMTGKITNIQLMGKVIARDIIDIWWKAPAIRNNSSDVTILKEIKLQFSDMVENYEYWLLLMMLSYDFGYMRGQNKMRKKLRGRK